MLRLNNLPLPLDKGERELRLAAAKKLNIRAEELLSLRIVKKSVDARDKGDVHFVYSVDVSLHQEDDVLRQLRFGTAVKVEKGIPSPPLPRASFARRPIVAGAGPAGLFAALELAKAGAMPILIERGKPVAERAKDIDVLLNDGILNEDSNVLFGEGGAGAFSDGKLTTGIKSSLCHDVLQTLVRCGAPEEILNVQKAHIGTDLLRGVVQNLREEIKALGGEVLFETKLTGLHIEKGALRGVTVSQEGKETQLETDTLILAIGHSARDTCRMAYQFGVPMAQKPFSVGARIEHPQSLINKSQYGKFAGHPKLGAADYKLSVRTPDGRGAYTFCMCPGGVVIPAASQQGGVCVNGMSYHARAGENANSALLVGVTPLDYGDDHPLAGFEYQRALEQAAFRAGGGNFRAPVQRVEDFLKGRASTHLGSVTPSYRPGVTPCDLNTCLPKYIAEDMRIGILQMDRQLNGFAHPDAVLTGVEARSSSPVRMVRDENHQSEIQGIFPAGEGAGYAGGIMSAAVDGIACAQNALKRNINT